MEEQTIAIKVRDGYSLFAPKRRLTADSRILRYLIDEMKYDELEMDEFSREAVSLFLTILEDKKLGEIGDASFRELHELAVVFEVVWLKDDCRSLLRSRMNSATEDQDKTILFGECWYILKKWKEKDVMDPLISYLAPKDNSSFISDFMSDIDKLETEQINLMLKLGGSDTDLFLRTILHNLVGQRELNEKVKLLLQKMNLALSWERNEELYLEVFDTISNLSEISVADMRFTHQIRSDTQRLVSSRREKRKTNTSLVVDFKKYNYLLNSCSTLNYIINAVSEDRVTSIFMVVELLLDLFYHNSPNREETQIFVTTLENICRNKTLQKISQQYLDIIIAALNYSNLEQSDELLILLNEIKNNETLSTYHENVRIIKRDKVITVNTEYTDQHQYTFKHPGTGTCTESGKCGFILRYSYIRDGNGILELCKNSEDYTATGIHYHDIISTHEMYLYTVQSGNTAAGNKVTVAGMWNWEKKWLPYIAHWKFEQLCTAYNVTDYLVAKNTKS